MYRVELKERVWMRGSLTCRMFLMYRVELKVVYLQTSPGKYQVPNVPCGVESFASSCACAFGKDVPNVPCGVER